ncbi:aminodeoxychorismate lyase [Clostridia bacterium]|nr:aminodeoxychorismate lyase [Clostridia bacterium]
MERKKKRSKAPIVLVILVILLVAGWLAFNKFYSDMTGAAESGNTAPVTVVIPEGTTTTGVSSILLESGLTKEVPFHDVFFKMWCKKYRETNGADVQFKMGTYELNRNMNLDEIAAILVAGNLAATKSFTIPEGYNITQIARTLEEAGICWKEDFLREAENGEFNYLFLADCPPGRERLEGFLYPETYEIYDDATAHDVIEKMLAQFDLLFSSGDHPNYYDRAAELGMSVRDVVTMGSIIERESVKPEERPLMAGVFYNRLEQGMLLQSCATIQYILGEPKQFLTNADTQIESPYNTYLHEGLPPGPICNPRMASIEAALYPDDNDFIYFVLSPDLDGSHRFSADYNEFLRNKDAYYAAEE